MHYSLLFPYESLMPSLRAQYAIELAHWSTEWINKWPEIKRNKILKSMRDDPIRPHIVKPFPKKEIVLVAKKARLIQAYANEHTAALYAPQFYSFQKALATVSQQNFNFHGIDFQMIFTSGMNHQELGSWMNDKIGLRFYERDGKSWDATMQKNHFDAEIYLLKLLDKQLAAFVKKCMNTKGSYVDKIGNFISYLVEATRKSGHNDTTSGNSYINILIAIMAIVLLPNPPTKVRGLFAGDDCLIAYDGSDQTDAIRENESALGIVPEARGFDNPLDVSFISGQWYPNPTGYSFGPKLGKLFAKLFWSVSEIAARKPKQWTSSVADSFYPVFRTCPGMRVFLQRQITTSDRVETSKYTQDLRLIDCDWDYFLFVKYGLSPAAMAGFEQYLKKLPIDSIKCSHSVADAIIDVDLADLLQRPLAMALKQH